MSASNLTLGQLREKYYQQFVNLVNNSDFLDNEQKQKSFSLFLSKIKDGTLEVRKTEQPCHAKMYIFDYDGPNHERGEDLGNVITGSSNLSYQGLAGRTEINVRLKDKQTYIDAKKIFEELWENSVSVIDQSTLSQWEDKVIKHVWYEKLFSPYLMFVRVLSEYFNIPSSSNVLTPHDITQGKYSNLKYLVIEYVLLYLLGKIYWILLISANTCDKLTESFKTLRLFISDLRDAPALDLNT